MTGNLVISKALIQSVDSDSELAFIIAPVLGHFLARHYHEAFQQYRIMAFLIAPWSFFIPTVLRIAPHPSIRHNKFARNITLATKILLLAHPFCIANIFDDKFSSYRECEADEIGLMLMTAAGYEPEAAPKAARRVRDSKDAQVRSFGQNHECFRPSIGPPPPDGPSLPTVSIKLRLACDSADIRQIDTRIRFLEAIVPQARAIADEAQDLAGDVLSSPSAQRRLKGWDSFVRRRDDRREEAAALLVSRCSVGTPRCIPRCI